MFKTCMMSVFDQIRRAERHSRCDVTDQQASHGSREAADSYHARLRRQLRAGSSRTKRASSKLLDYISFVHQQRRQLLHLSGGEQGIQERDESYDTRHVKESANWKRADNSCAARVQVGVPD